MKKIIVFALAGLTLAACTPTEQGAAVGAATGAVIGGVTTGRVGGAIVGAAAGGIAGAVIGRVSEGSNRCYYRDRYGRRYISGCPSGY